MKMNRKTKGSIILSSLAAIGIAGSLIAGATYALFTSESSTNIAISSGKVDVTATIDQDSIKTKQLNDTDWLDGSGNTFEGVVELDKDGNLSISNIVPGDAIKFNIIIKNDSTVSARYRTIVKAKENNGLFEGLTVKLGDEAYNGRTAVSKYATLKKGSADIIIPIEIEFPKERQNQYQGKSCTITYAVEAIQGNAAAKDTPDTDYLVYTPSDLTVFANLINDGEFTYTNVIFQNDIDMENAAYVSPHYDTGNVNNHKHDLNIIGGGYTISNFAPTHNGHASGLIGGIFAGGATVSVSNLKFDKVTIVGDYVNEPICAGGPIVGASDNGIVKISNVEVSNIDVCAVKYGGSLVGYSTGTLDIEDVKVTDSNIEAYTAGGIAGNVSKSVSIENPSGSNISVTGSKKEGGMIGAVNSGTTNITDYDNSKYVATISKTATGSQGEIVGQNLGTVNVNGEPLNQ